MVSFSVDLEGFSLRLRVKAPPNVPRARRLKLEDVSGIGVESTTLSRPVVSKPFPQSPASGYRKPRPPITSL